VLPQRSRHCAFVRQLSEHDLAFVQVTSHAADSSQYAKHDSAPVQSTSLQVVCGWQSMRHCGDCVQSR